MAWFLLQFAFFSVVLRAAALAFQSLVLGGLLYVAVIQWPAGPAAEAAMQLCRRGIRWAAVALAVAQLLYVSVDTAILMGTLQLSLRDVVTADYFLAGTGAVLACVALTVILRGSGSGLESRTRFLLNTLPFAAILLAASIWTSHSVSRLDHRVVTALLTGLHQLAVAAWIGALPFLLVSLRAVQRVDCARFLVRRFSSMAVASVATLIGAGAALSYFYIAAWPALYGTAYGFMILTKSAMLAILLLLGASNWWLARSLDDRAGKNSEDEVSTGQRRTPRPLLVIRRIGEAEIGIGFSIILAAASLTSQPPAVDLVQDRLSTHEIVERYHPIFPRFTTPTFDQLSPATPLETAINSYDNSALAQAHNQDPDIAWSEYSHHWAGLIMLAIGVMAWLSRSPKFPWARVWPLGFVGLAIFSFLRGDTENWPFGPISFWKSFYDPEVAMHRVYDVLIVLYALFEWGVQTGRLKSRKAAYVFPLAIGLGGATLLLHSHALGNVKNELLIEMAHNSMGILAVFGGWARLLEVRLPIGQGGRVSAIAGHVWPACLVLIGCLLLNYREA
ncbi:MAG: copper resistance D family protein [Candidatus Acidiferrales bacterium]